MEIEILNGPKVSHSKAQKIKVRDGNKTITIEFLPGGVSVSVADSTNHERGLTIAPIHTNRILIS